MSKVQLHNVDQKVRRQMIGNFYDVITELKNKDQVVGFFMGLLTPSEALMLSRRIQIAQMLLEDHSYEDICRELNVGSQTVASVYRWLYSDNEHFRKHIKQHIKKQEKINKRYSQKYYTDLADRYPQHRFLKDLLGL